MDNKRFNLAYHWVGLVASCQKICLKEIDFRDLMDKGESSHYPSYRRTADPDRAYSDSFRLKSRRPNKFSSCSTPVRNHQIRSQESPFITIPGNFQKKIWIQGQKQDHLQQEEERVRPNDPEAVGFGERSAQEPEVAVNDSRISSPININITPTQIDHNVVTTESNMKSDALWQQMSQCSDQTQKQFEELQESHERMKSLTASMEKIVKILQEGHAQLRKSSEETNKRLNLVFEEQHYSKRDRDCLNKDIDNLFNVYHNIEPQSSVHVMDNPYNQDAMFMNKEKSLSQYQDGDNMSYSEKEALKQLPEASGWPKFSRTGEYDHMELMGYIYGIFIDVPSIPDYWITARLNTEPKGHASIWYTEMKEIHGRRSWPWWKSQIIQKYSNFTLILQNTMEDDYIGTIIKEINIPHQKGNIRLNPEFVVLDDAHIQGFLLGTDYHRMYGIDIYNSKTRNITIGTNKEKKFSLDTYQISAQDPLEEPLNEFRERQFSTTLTSKQKLSLLKILRRNRPAFSIGGEPLGKIRGHDIELYLDVERPYPLMLRRKLYPESLETRKEMEKHINELLEMDVIRNIEHNEIVEITTPVLVTWHYCKCRLCGYLRALNNYTKADRYPIPRIPHALDKLAKAKYITKMHCMQGFHQNGVKPNSM
ncbi:hypothetical protein O181_030558 [Austropuccinia psidii MF-1]|uniref:Uncharacterized protein n=1 Tax=Austropuccinia psidii MF-1 TaxID=1389203 RepID=A0A9Q3CXX9_9BASI|nr:hypothetical protein [Austropuccinia psidii MF-1]